MTRHRWRGAGAGLLLSFTLWSLAARAAPNPLCPGRCEGGTVACGAASDCEGAPCLFEASCLDGHGALTPLIARVVPEGPGGLNDPRVGWSCGLLTCEPAADHLAVRSTWGSGAGAVKDIALSPGRYLLMADLAADSRTWGALSIVAGSLEAWSEPVVQESGEGRNGADFTWHRSSVFFEVPSNHAGPIQIRLHGEGPGRVGLKRVVIVQLAPFSAFIRVKTVDAQATGLAALGVRVPTEEGGRHVVCEDASCRVGPGEGSTSDWLDLGALAASLHDVAPGSASDRHAPTNRMTVSLQIDACGDDGCVPRAEPVEVTFELAFAKDPTAIVWRGTKVVDPARVGLVLPHAPRPIHPYALTGAFLHDLLVEDLQNADPIASPTRTIRLGATTAPLDPYDAGPVDASAHDILASMGLDIAGWFETHPSPATREAAAERGLIHRVLEVPDVLASYEGDFDLSAIAAHTRVELALDRSPLGADLNGCTRDTCIARLHHAPRVFAGDAYEEGFIAWLDERGETADTLGLEALTDARALASWPPGPAPADPKALRLHLRQVEFAYTASARALAEVRDALHERAVIPVGLELSSLPLQALRIAFDEANLSALFSSSATGPTDDCELSRISAQAELAASIAMPWREAAEARGEPFVIAASVRAGRAELPQVLVEHAARGVTWFIHEGYGPHDASLTRAQGGLGEMGRAWMSRVREANLALGAFEPWFEKMRRPIVPTVILASESESLLSDTPTLDNDALGWHAALSHAARPAELMLESDIAQGFLEHPVTTRRLLVVTRKNVSRAAWSAIERWVESGNTLVLGPELAAYDEDGQLAAERTAWLGAVVGEARRGGTSLRWSGSLGVSSVLVPGEWREVLALIGTPIALSSDDRAVVVRVPRGRGRVIVSGVPLGAIYRQAESGCEPRRPARLPRYTRDYSAVLRDAMSSFAPSFSTPPSVDPRVSVTRLVTESGRPFVLVVPWLGSPEPVSIHLAEAAGCSSVREEVEGVELPITFGSLFATLSGPAILTWDEGGCAEVVEEQPELVEPAPPKVVDDGCSSGAGWGAGLIPLALLVGRRFHRGRAGQVGRCVASCEQPSGGVRFHGDFQLRSGTGPARDGGSPLFVDGLRLHRR